MSFNRKRQGFKATQNAFEDTHLHKRKQPNNVFKPYSQTRGATTKIFQQNRPSVNDRLKKLRDKLKEEVKNKESRNSTLTNQKCDKDERNKGESCQANSSQNSSIFHVKNQTQVSSFNNMTTTATQSNSQSVIATQTNFIGKIQSSSQKKVKRNVPYSKKPQSETQTHVKSKETPTPSISSNFIDQRTQSTTSNLSTVSHSSLNSWYDYGKIMDELFNKNYQTQNQSTGTSFNEDSSMDWEEANSANPEVQNNLYIVIDTNIFLNELCVLEEIISNGSNGNTNAIIYVPWMVNGELDNLKDDRKVHEHLRKKAQEAIKLINKTMIEKPNKLVAQNVFNVDSQKNIGKSPDDKILAACLQAREKYQNILLLSNDVNLRNKVLMHKIPALSCNEMFASKNTKFFVDDTIFEKVSKVMSDCCSYIICECAKEAYGGVWNKMSMLRNPPWSFKTCMQIFKKYWSAVFRMKLLKHTMKTIEELEEILTVLQKSKNNEKIKEFVEASLSLCFYLRDIEEHREFVEKCSSEIKKYS